MSNILVIDDEYQIVEIISRYLAAKGYRVEKAYTAESGLEKIKGTKGIDLVILDEKMPGEGGKFFREEAARAGIKVPVLVLTGSIGLLEMSDRPKSEYKNLLYKPVRLSELQKAVEELIGSYS